MAHPLHLTIADIAFAMSVPAGVEIVENDSAYRDFLTPPDNSLDVVPVPIRLTFDEPPDVEALPLLFDTGEAWQAYREGDAVVLRIKAPVGFGKHLWVVRLGADGLPHDLFCGSAWVNRSGDQTVLTNPLRYPLDQILMMYLGASRRSVIIHAAGLHRAGVGVLFAGVSGAGKSTLTGLLAEVPELGHLSDDRVMVRRTSRGIRVYGTPWPGEAGVAANESARLGSVVLLRQADHHQLRRLEPREAFERLLPMVSILWYDADLATAALAWCDELLREVPAYELSFKRDEGVAETIEELLPQPAG
jgi:hypothetical protein